MRHGKNPRFLSCVHECVCVHVCECVCPKLASDVSQVLALQVGSPTLGCHSVLIADIFRSVILDYVFLHEKRVCLTEGCLPDISGLSPAWPVLMKRCCRKLLEKPRLFWTMRRNGN